MKRQNKELESKFKAWKEEHRDYGTTWKEFREDYWLCEQCKNWVNESCICYAR